MWARLKFIETLFYLQMILTRNLYFPMRKPRARVFHYIEIWNTNRTKSQLLCDDDHEASRFQQQFRTSILILTMLQLVEDDLDTKFDKLVEQGNIIYGPSTVTSIIDDGIPVIPWESIAQRRHSNKYHSSSFVYVQLFERSHSQKRNHQKNQWRWWAKEVTSRKTDPSK